MVIGERQAHEGSVFLLIAPFHREWDKESARREIRLIFAMIAIVGVGLTILGFLTA